MSLFFKKILIITGIIFIGLTDYSTAQKFVPDNSGYVKDPKFSACIKNKGYSLVGAFEKQIQGSFWYAKALKDGKWITIDNFGNIVQPTVPGKSIKDDVREIKATPDNGEGGEVVVGNGFNPFTYVHPSNIDLKIIQSDNKKGLSNTKKNKIIVPAIYDDVRLTNFKFVIVKLNGKWGVISKDGHAVTAPKYDEVRSLGVNMAGTKTITADAEIVRIGDKWGLLSEEGKEIVSPQFDDIKSSWVINSLLTTRLNNKYGLLNKNGKELVKPIYKQIQEFNKEGESIVTINNGQGTTYGLIDSLGNEDIKPIYKRIAFLDKDLVAVYAQDYPNPKVGLSNVNGKILTQPIYTNINFFKNNLALIYINIDNHQYNGFIDRNGKEVIKPVYQDISIFNGQDDFCQVKLNGKYGILTIVKQDFIIKPIYDQMGQITLNRISVKQDGKYGMIDYEGNILAATKYDQDFSLFRQGLIQNWLNGKRCIIDLYGDEYFNQVSTIASPF